MFFFFVVVVAVFFLFLFPDWQIGFACLGGC